jgi:hypothetical protein
LIARCGGGIGFPGRQRAHTSLGSLLPDLYVPGRRYEPWFLNICACENLGRQDGRQCDGMEGDCHVASLLAKTGSVVLRTQGYVSRLAGREIAYPTGMLRDRFARNDKVGICAYARVCFAIGGEGDCVPSGYAAQSLCTSHWEGCATGN